MSQLAIRCHPCTPVSTEEVDKWLRAEVEGLREQAPHAALHVLRLSQAQPTGDAEVGWLIELDPAGGEPPLDDDGLARILRDLRLLGLQPTLMRQVGDFQISPSASIASATRSKPTMFAPAAKSPGRP